MAGLRSRAGIVILVLLAAVTATGCGIDESRERPPFEPSDISSPQSMLVTNADIDTVGLTNPYSAVLRWWQALQQGNVQALRHIYAQTIPARAAKRQIEGFRPRYSMPVNPQTHLQGKVLATVRAHVRTAVPFHDRPNVISVRDFPTHYFLVRTLGGWKLRVDSYEHYTKGRHYSQLVTG
jgi:hypothetical protein